MACKPMDVNTRENLNHLWDEAAPTPSEPTDTNSSTPISSAETDKSEPSAEAVEAVSKAICGDGWWVYAQGKARAALTADPLRKALGDLESRMRARTCEATKEAEAEGDPDISFSLQTEADVTETWADELAALLEKHGVEV